MRRPRIRIRIRKVIALLLLGVAGAVVVPLVLTIAFDLTLGPQQSAAASTGQGQWTVTRWDRAAGVRLQSVREKGRNWSISQATGAPDTPTGGDQVTAWASATGDGSREWLVLEFATAVVPKAVHVYEMCSTGALDRVSIFDGETEVTAWEGVDPLQAQLSMGTADIPIKGTFPTSRVKIYLNSPAFSSWNEVDAVGLEDVGGNIQWAVNAQASSEYGSSRSGPTDPSNVIALLPKWALPHVASASQSLPPMGEDRIIEARGWPMVSMYGQRRSPASPAFVTSVAYLSTPLTSASLIAAPPSSPVDKMRVTPTRIIPLGFAVDAIFYAIIFGAISWLIAVPRKFLSEAARVRSGHCIACGYDLRYDFLSGCSECGWNRSDGSMSRIAADTPLELKLDPFSTDRSAR